MHKPVGVSLAHDSSESHFQVMMISAKTSPKVKGDGEWLYMLYYVIFRPCQSGLVG